MTKVNTVLEDNPARWMITISLVPKEAGDGVLTETRIIETEPSLWWRSEKWQDEEESYSMCVFLCVHYIGA